MILFLLLLSFSAILNPMNKKQSPRVDTESSSPRSPLSSNFFTFRPQPGSTESLPPLPRRDLEPTKKKLGSKRKKKKRTPRILRPSSSSSDINTRKDMIQLDSIERISKKGKQKKSSSHKMHKLKRLSPSRRKLADGNSKRKVQQREKRPEKRRQTVLENFPGDGLLDSDLTPWIMNKSVKLDEQIAKDVIEKLAAMDSNSDLFANQKLFGAVLSACLNGDYESLNPYLSVRKRESAIAQILCMGSFFNDLYLNEVLNRQSVLMMSLEQQKARRKNFLNSLKESRQLEKEEMSVKE